MAMGRSRRGDVLSSDTLILADESLITLLNLRSVWQQRKPMHCFASDTDSSLITDDSGESTLNEAAAQAEAGERKGDRAGQPLASAYIRFKLLSLHVGQFRDRVAMAV